MKTLKMLKRDFECNQFWLILKVNLYRIFSSSRLRARLSWYQMFYEVEGGAVL